MPLTEEEAKTKWCPFARVVGVFAAGNEPAVPGHNRTVFSSKGSAVEQKSPAPASCIASGCMAWRWSFIFVNADGMEINADTLGMFAECTKEGAARKGFCGLAGKAE